MKSKTMYIYNLPHIERRELCRILDQNDKWEDLGGIYMKYDHITLQAIKRKLWPGESPTDELLTLWGHQNHTVLELFVLLSRMKHYHSMLVLKPFVEEKFHRLICEGEGNLNFLFNQLQIKNQSAEKKLDIANENFNFGSKAKSVQHKCEQIRKNNKDLGQVINDKEINKDPCEQILSPNQHLYAIQEKSVQRKCEQLKTQNNLMRQGFDVNIKQNNSIQQNITQDDNITSTKEKEINCSPMLLLQNQEKKAGNNASMNIGSLNSADIVSSIPQIAYDELQKATNNWNSATILGRGGFGTVYMGIWKCTQVAIKRIEPKSVNSADYQHIQMQQSLRELHYLNMYRHDNVLPLYGYSVGGNQPCLVYQFMAGGCLEQRLHTKNPDKWLDWKERLHIVRGTARGLQFLHTIGDKPLIHGDIKSANILLDPTNEPKIGDFGLAREGPQSDYTHIEVSRVHGTRPYLPDEFLRAKKMSTKVDTYSFGVVLFEVCTGLSAFNDKRPNKYLKDHVVNHEGNILDLKDSRCSDNDYIFVNMINIGKVCVSKRAKDRPEMVSVLIQLEKISD